MVKALLLGLLKGAAIGAGVGYGAYALELGPGWNWLVYGVVGFLVGFLVGRPLWALLTDKGATSVAGILKAVVGFGVAVGLWALVAKAWGGFELALAGQTRWVQDWQPVLGAAIGGLWGALIELDDASDDKPAAARRPAR